MEHSHLNLDESNRIVRQLAEAFDGSWTLEAESDTVGRAYHPDPTDPDTRREDIVSVEIRDDGDGLTVQSTAFNAARGMGDLHDFERADSLDAAIAAADRLATEVRDL